MSYGLAGFGALSMPQSYIERLVRRADDDFPGEGQVSAALHPSSI